MVDIVINTYESYLKNPLNVYKSVNKEWVVVLQKLPDTMTNEKGNPNLHALKADRLKIILIFNKFNPLFTVDFLTRHTQDGKLSQTVLSSESHTDEVFKVGNILSVTSDKLFGTDFGEKSSIPMYYNVDGISFYSDIHYAYFAELDTVGDYTGPFISWHGDGDIEKYGNYVDGKKNNRWIHKWIGTIYETFYENGVDVSDKYKSNERSNYDFINVPPLKRRKIICKTEVY